MQLTIHQTGKFAWFSERATKGSSYRSVFDALRAHIRYIEEKAVATFNSAARIFGFAKEELRRRWDARIALKFWIAVPKDWQEKEALERVVAFVSEQLNVPTKHIYAAFHAHENNPHVHLLIYPRDRQGKKLRIGRRELKEFHRAWDLYLQEHGYAIKRFKQPKNFRIAEKAFLELREPLEIWQTIKGRGLYAEYRQLKAELMEALQELDEEVEQQKFAEISEREIEEANKTGFLSKVKQMIFGDKNENFEQKQLKQIKAQLAALGFSRDDKVGVVLVAEGKRPMQRILSVEKLLDTKFIRFLRAKNSENYNIYITLNRLKPTAKKRRKADFEEKQNKIYLDIDGDKIGKPAEEILRKILQEENLPLPTLAISTSPQNLQVVWVLKTNEEAQKLEAVMQQVAEKYGLDHTQDISRVFRLAGFFNRKPNKGNFVYIVSKLSSFQPVAFEHFEHLMIKKRVEQRAKEEKVSKKIETYRASVKLDEYIDALEFIAIRNPYAEVLMPALENLAKEVIKGNKRFKSASEFELALLHRFDMVLTQYLPLNKRREIISEIFEQLLYMVRPQKLKRNPKYVAISLSKIYPAEMFEQEGTPSRGAAAAHRVRDTNADVEIGAENGGCSGRCRNTDNRQKFEQNFGQLSYRRRRKGRGKGPSL